MKPFDFLKSLVGKLLEAAAGGESGALVFLENLFEELVGFLLSVHPSDDLKARLDAVAKQAADAAADAAEKAKFGAADTDEVTAVSSGD